MQLAKLRAGLPDVLATNAFWRARLHDVRGWDDFERLPFVTKSDLMTDDSNVYTKVGTEFTSHHTVNPRTTGKPNAIPSLTLIRFLLMTKGRKLKCKMRLRKRWPATPIILLWWVLL